jgi:hypothetical protein
MGVKRIEITVSEETWERLNAARGHEPRASFVKRALQEKLDEVDAPLTPEVSKALREAWESPELERQLTAPATELQHGADMASAAMERQRAMNKAKGL